MKKRKEINWERWHWLRQHIKRVRKSPEPEEPETKIANYLTTIFAAIPLITGSIYLSGMAHFFAKCLVHGLNISEFPQPTDVTLATGYLLWLMVGKMYGLSFLGIVLSILSLAIILFLCVSIRLRWAWFWHRIGLIKFPKARRFFRRRARVPAPKIYLMIVWIKIIYDRIAILVVPALILLLPTLFCFNEGLNTAQAEVKKLESDLLSAQSGKALSPLLGDTPHIRLMCNTTHCAYRLKGGEIQLVRHDQVDKVTWIAPKETADNSSKENSTDK
ncbi:hypothetical protein [Aeromonas caviae]|uniref:hypothetical protein n=1 Tax=Aeromonas caviae TaxID=648 RepID=UPI002B4868DA|nr:hypothetical protein [Aeromonas caviae]